jgi:ribosomal protein S18 acetylase RimI-like enzyme
MTIRPARPEDIPQLSRLKHPKDEEHRRDYQVAAQMALLKVNTEDAVLLVMEDNDEIIGQVLLRIQGSETELGYPNMQDLYIAEDNRSHGLGSQLIKECEQIAKEKGYEKMSVAVNPTLNLPAKHLYERLGYRDIGRMPYLDGVYDGDEDWVIDMVKEI